MKQPLRAVLLSVIALSSAFAQAAPADETAPAAPREPVRIVESELPLGGAVKTKIELAIGELAIRGEDVDRILMRLLIFCDKRASDQKNCEPHAADVPLNGATRGDALEVSVGGISKATSRNLSLRLEVRVPRDMPIEASMRDGQLRIDDLLANIKASVTKGSVDIALPHDQMAELDLSSGGEASVELTGERVTSKGIGQRRLVWTRGTGTVKVEAESSLGAIRVVLQ
jgi:hypothetical protein